MSKLTDVLKLIFCSTASLEELKLQTLNSFAHSSKILETEGIPKEHSDKIQTFLLAMNGEMEECIIFFQQILDLVTKERKKQSFYEIKDMSLDLSQLTKKEYTEYYEYRNTIEDQYYCLAQIKIRDAAEHF